MTDTQDDRELSTYTHAHDGDQIAIYRNGQPVYFVRDVAAQGEKAVLLRLLNECAGVIQTIDPESESEADMLGRLLAEIDSAQGAKIQGELLMTYIKPPASHECTWRSGPPPEVGWWPASRSQHPEILRWWNGRKWGLATHCERNYKEASANADISTDMSCTCIPWTDRWWLK